MKCLKCGKEVERNSLYNDFCLDCQVVAVFTRRK